MSDPTTPATGSAGEVFAAFLRQGLTAFGGPVAHLGFFHRDFVERRGWLSPAAYAQLVALCQFLPGPASSQVGLALGFHRAGWAGALAAWCAFTLPSAAIMALAGLGLAAIVPEPGAAWLQGLKIAALAVVVQALIAMGRQLTPDRARQTVALAAFTVLVLWPGALTQVGVIAAGGLLGLLPGLRLGRGPNGMTMGSGAAAGATADGTIRGPGWTVALLLLAFFFALLFGLPLLAEATGNPWLARVEAYYRAGALVFGGGHVVLPLLESATVAPGWVDRESFLAGYGLAQAVPGPLFTFSAFLGASDGGLAVALLALLAIFLPAWLLVLGALPAQARLQAYAPARHALAGANAAVVGLLAAALYDPIASAALTGPGAVAGAAVAIVALLAWKLPAWALVALAFMAGLALDLADLAG
ncbi:MAG: chromate efflux transporter [Azospirillaceae bacterium]